MALHLLRAPLDELESLWLCHVWDRCPFQYVVGNEHWKDLVVAIQDGVLIPRPKAEAVVDMVTIIDCEQESWAFPSSSSAATCG
ncbi:release factor glutamine methyltransferase [Hordeum vulgare]|nr:release factor glutamine methyltransferase [Hordeum vulgare]